MMDVKNDISPNIDKLLDDLVTKKANSLAKIGTLVTNESKKRCGVDTGVLRNSIQYSTNESSVSIGSPIEYASYHHNHNKFLQSAIYENIDKISSIIEEIL